MGEPESKDVEKMRSPDPKAAAGFAAHLPKQKSTASNACPATNTVLPWLPPNQLVGNELKAQLCLSRRNHLNEGGGAKTETKEAV
ncbi:Hypothetical predicted protein [Prunus dulcis]|uniref:Uncharacterized protein n=1 Tax=Prunus dulcis TaxID=3755 RepID=A0A5E4FDN8_PRUDU|nr:Hypothetical predicted protein [Prunus dulcis]